MKNGKLVALKRIISEAFGGDREVTVPVNVTIVAKVPLRCGVNESGRIGSVSHLSFPELTQMIADGTARINEVTWPQLRDVEREHEYLSRGGKRFS
jgi:hypothetical protein